MTTRQFLWSAWDWHYVPLGICAAMLVTYAITFRSKLSGHAGLLFVGLGFFLLALVSPVNVLADGYLFSAHMLQHLLLLLIVPLCVLLSLPAATRPPTVRRGIGGRIGRLVTLPMVTWSAGVGAMWLWHAPALCNAATANPVVRDAQIVSLLVMGSMFWWPIAGPRPHQHLAPLAGVAYLFSACVGCTLLGILITFAPVGVCAMYLQPVDRLGILPLIRHRWGLTPTVDQQIGGLLMWVPACLVYLGGIMGLLARWYRDPATGALTSPEPSAQEMIPSCARVSPWKEKNNA